MTKMRKPLHVIFFVGMILALVLAGCSGGSGGSQGSGSSGGSDNAGGSGEMKTINLRIGSGHTTEGACGRS